MAIILCGDIGGTHTRLALVEMDGGRNDVIRRQSFPSREFPSFEKILAEFAPPAGVAAAFAVAGPVGDGRAKVTNLPWTIEAETLRRRFAFAHVSLLNDLEAVAWGIGALSDSAFVTLQDGKRLATGNQAVIAAGTGLGEAGLFWDGKRHWPFACEGGHADFAPRNERELALWRRLRDAHGHVSWERVASGLGIPMLYAHLCQEAAQLPRIDVHAGEAAAEVSRLAATGDPLAQETLRWFVSLLGAEAGNLALKLMSRGGVFLAGGIAPKLLPYFKEGTFVASFCDKGRMRPLLEAMPVRMVRDEEAALHGLIRYFTESACLTRKP